jgi:hypothetical protein
MMCKIRSTYSDSVWKGKVWGQIGEELKKSGQFQCFLLRILKLLSFYITEVLIINK